MTFRFLVGMLYHSAGGVRHEIRPIRMRYLISSLGAQEHQSGEFSMSKISSLTKSVTFFPGRKSLQT